MPALHTGLCASLLTHFTTIVDSCVNRSAPMAVAVSGGSDSMALALLLKDYASTCGVALTALTVDHGLRAESRAEATQVAGWMHHHQIAHHILSLPTSIDTARNLQAQAREARYGALTAWCAAQGVSQLFLAHHAEDQAETVALQQHRGATAPSRAGMPLVRVRAGIALVRPLLGVRKAQLQTFLKAQQQPWLEDPTNHSPRHARNRVRAGMDDAQFVALWHEAQRMGQQRHTEECARNAWCAAHAQLSDEGHASLDFAAWQALPEPLRSDVLSHTVRVVGGKMHRPRAHETARLLARLLAEASGKATLGHCLIRWQRAQGILHIAPEKPCNRMVEIASAAPHIPRRLPPKTLEVAPFWWFNSSPYFESRF